MWKVERSKRCSRLHCRGGGYFLVQGTKIQERSVTWQLLSSRKEALVSYDSGIVQYSLSISVLGSSGGYSGIISTTTVGHVQAVRWWQAAGVEGVRQVGQEFPAYTRKPNSGYDHPRRSYTQSLKPVRPSARAYSLRE